MVCGTLFFAHRAAGGGLAPYPGPPVDADLRATGSGKTLAAFLACIDRLVRKARGALEDRTEVLYVSPLKALSNDIQKNLEVPLAEILRWPAQHGLLMPEIRIAVRTGDTPAQGPAAPCCSRPAYPGHHAGVALHPAHGGTSRADAGATCDTVIVDEIHAVADDKRGAHLALSLARLDALVDRAAGESAAHRPVGHRKPIEDGGRVLSAATVRRA